MKLTPFFAICSADATVTGLLGKKIYPLRAPENVVRPYAVYRTVSGLPEEYVDKVPDYERQGLMVEVFAEEYNEARAIAEAVENAVNPYSVITGFEDDFDDATLSYMAVLTLDWIINR